MLRQHGRRVVPAAGLALLGCLGPPPLLLSVWVVLSSTLAPGPDPVHLCPGLCGPRGRLWPSVPEGAGGSALARPGPGTGHPWAPAAPSRGEGGWLPRECGTRLRPACATWDPSRLNLVGCSCWCLFQIVSVQGTSCLPSGAKATQRAQFESRHRAHQGWRPRQAAWRWARGAVHLHVIPGPSLVSLVKRAISGPTGGPDSWQRDCLGSLAAGGPGQQVQVLASVAEASSGDGVFEARTPSRCPARALCREGSADRWSCQGFSHSPSGTWGPCGSHSPPPQQEALPCRGAGLGPAVEEPHSVEPAPTDAPPASPLQWPTGSALTQSQPCSARLPW